MYEPPPVPGSRPVRPQPPSEAVRRPSRVEPVAGTPYGLAIYPAPPMTSGQAIGSLVAGLGAVLASLMVACFGFAGAVAAAEGQAAGFGPLVGGAFAILTGFLGLAGIGLGVAGIRQIRSAAIEVGGRGMAVTGIVAGGSGMVIAACSLGVGALFAFAG